MFLPNTGIRLCLPAWYFDSLRSSRKFETILETFKGTVKYLSLWQWLRHMLGILLWNRISLCLTSPLQFATPFVPSLLCPSAALSRFLSYFSLPVCACVFIKFPILGQIWWQAFLAQLRETRCDWMLHLFGWSCGEWSHYWISLIITLTRGT